MSSFTIAEKNEKFFIEKLNRIIAEAIDHGGDNGGAYYTNRDRLIRAMRDLLKWTGMDKTVGIMDDGEVPRFFLKRHILPDE